MHVLPQEIEVWYIIPAIRKEIATCLISDFSYSYDQVGTSLSISKAAVSQYVKNKRASKVKLPKLAKNEIMKSCKRISSNKTNANYEITAILELIRKKKLPCEVCEKDQGILKDCKEIISVAPTKEPFVLKKLNKRERMRQIIR